MTITSFKSYLSSTFVMDLRSLALFRIGLGVVILTDLANRFEDLRMFYTDEGLLMSERVLVRNWSIHAWFGSVEWAYFLFGLAAVSAIMILVGYRTKLFLPLLFILTISLHMRNPAINNAGDQLLRLILLIGCFLPLNAFFAVQTRETEQHYSKFSPWILVYYLQIITMYFIAGFSKFNMTWNWGMGIHYAMHQYTYAKASASWLLQYPTLSFLLTQVVLLLERFGWVLLLIPWEKQIWRLICVVSFVSLHLGLYVFMELGMFPMIALVAWLPLIPSMAWKGFYTGKNAAYGLNRFGWKNWIFPILFIIVASYGVYRKNSKFRKYKIAEKVMQNTQLYQGWTVFSGPNKYDSWIVVESELANGDRIDLYRDGGPVSYDRPKLYSAEFKSHRQRKFFKNLTRPGFGFYRIYYLNWAVKEWNQSHSREEQVVHAWMYNFKEDILPQGGYGPVEKKLLADADGESD